MCDSPIIIFDGVCNLCNGAVTFIINRDPGKLFRFAPMQSELAARLVVEFPVPEIGGDTLVLIKDDASYVRSDAALEIARDLTGWWSLLRILRIIPRVIRDALYCLLARNRYRLFGRRQHCVVPTSDISDRFIG